MTGVPGSVIVVGGGIVGLSTAYALHKAGIGVTVVERGPIPNALAASADHHRLIRFAHADRRGYAARMPDAFAAWRAMWADLGQPEARYYVPTGVLSVSLEQGDGADRSLRTWRSWACRTSGWRAARWPGGCRSSSPTACGSPC